MSVNPVWPFEKQLPKNGYINNPFWTTESTPTHDPCGYWFANPGGGDASDPAQRHMPSVGPLYSCGKNSSYNLGFGDTLVRWTHEKVPNIPQMSKVALGNQASLVIDENQNLWVVGANNSGQIGQGSANTVIDWAQIPGKWLSVAASPWYYYSLAIKTDGTLWATGNNSYGQLGLGDQIRRNYFEQVGLKSDWVKVACGGLHTMALDASNKLYASGSAGVGGLGLPGFDNVLEFTNTIDSVQDFCCGFYDSYIISSGDLYATGANGSGQQGMGDIIDHYGWRQSLSAPSDIVSIVAGNHSTGSGGTTFIIDGSGTLYGAGSNLHYMMGVADTSDKLTFENINSNVRSIAYTASSTLMIKSDGTLWGVGINSNGQLGFGDNIARTSWEQVGNKLWLEIQINITNFSMGFQWDGSYIWE